MNRTVFSIKFIFGVLVFNCISFFELQAQLTFNGNCPFSGSQVGYRLFDSTTAIPKAAGNGIIWDYSSVLSSTVQSVKKYLVPDQTQALSYPIANLIEQQDNTSFDVYETVSSIPSKLLFWGSSDYSTNLLFNDPIEIYRYPFAFGSNYTDSYSGQYSGAETGTIQGTYFVDAIGSGSVLLPGNNNMPVNLMTTSVFNHTISMNQPGAFQMTVTVKRFDFFTPNYTYPIISLVYTYIWEPGLRANVELKIADFATEVGIPETEQNQYLPVKHFYNQTSNEIRFISATNLQLEIYRVDGLKEQSINLEANTSQTVSLQEGMHIMRYEYNGHAYAKKLMIKAN